MQKNRKRDEVELTKILLKIRNLKEDLKHHKISNHIDLGKVHRTVRRGLAGELADIFELTKRLTDKTQEEIREENREMWSIRNRLTHDYDAVLNALLDLWLKYVVGDQFRDSIEKRLKKIQQNIAED